MEGRGHGQQHGMRTKMQKQQELLDQVNQYSPSMRVDVMPQLKMFMFIAPWGR